MCNGGRDESDAVLSQEMPSIAGSHQELEEERKDFPLEPSERAHLCWDLDFELLPSDLRDNKFLLS